ncbi:MAG: hypothetical protein OHM56_05415 [Spiroplasma phoeniceum]|nr:MAG: hypothetical protein OHM57_03240 [Spiroplasma phoeniceum]UZQ30937.1 MAG: hypothetical protein OHM57_04820 [Spiroplasma phoeniceum]UZQ33076.1 MAG: hypothetical protein OHM56_03775 [Spiroplasma phoeniceum]UZQ33364.1 MAG: hypothetical protein OHM56_05415 [Spiroplasma phoeniceum]
MSDEPHSIYERDMDTISAKEKLDSWYTDKKTNSATTINELNLIEKHTIWRIISNNKNDIKELFNKKWLEVNNYETR